MRYSLVCCLALATASSALGQGSFVNWENAPVHPLEVLPGGGTLALANLPNNRVELFGLSTGRPVKFASIPVGLDPTSVRARTATELWVVNTISDSISVIDVTTRNVKATLKTADEPWDVVFAGTPQRAFVSCGQGGVVQVFNPTNLAAAPTNIAIDANDPRALAVSPDGATVYAAIFHSGNASTVLGGGLTMGAGGFPPNVVSNPSGPYGGQNPPPNSGAGFFPPISPANLPAIAVGLIVKKNAAGQWMDDNNGNWTALVSGAQAASSGRVVGWDMPDRDVAIINAGTLSVSYARGLMNLCMGISVNPATGAVTVVGTDATNEVRFEPNLSGRFVRVMMGSFSPATPATVNRVDLNPHLTYATSTVAASERAKSVGDPRSIVWNAAGTKGYVAGMGSNNVVVISTAGARAGLSPAITVGKGACAIALDEARGRMYVLNRFEKNISVVDLGSEIELARVGFFDPTPALINTGRTHFYDTIKTSGLGQASCASCHVDGKMDRLGWDLGDPSGGIIPVIGNNLNAGVTAGTPFQPFHPMKGPMTTQTFQDIIGKEPHHWRGDKQGLESFNSAFVGLQGDDAVLTGAEMQEFENFVATIYFPPNPNRTFTNGLPTALAMPGQLRSGRFGNGGQPLPTGNAVTGLSLYRSTTRRLDGGALACVTCHTLPTGAGTDYTLSGATLVPIPPGPLGQRHLMLVSTDGSTNVSMKVPHLRNMERKTKFTMQQTVSHGGFGFLHDGSVDSLARFLNEPVFTVASDQETADLVAFMLSFSGSDLPQGSTTNILEPPGVPSNDTHAAVGAQVTFDVTPAPAASTNLLNSMISIANANKVGLVANGRRAGVQRGYRYSGGGLWQTDRAAESAVTTATLTGGAAAGTEVTFTVVPKGSETRIGIDEDLDGCLDGDEGVVCDIPAPTSCNRADITDIGDTGAGPDGQLTVDDVIAFINTFSDGIDCPGTAPCNRADITDIGDTGAGADGELTVDDIIAYFNSFSDGCP